MTVIETTSPEALAKAAEFYPVEERLIDAWQEQSRGIGWRMKDWTLESVNKDLDDEFQVTEMEFDDFTKEIRSGRRHFVCGKIDEGILDDDTYACCGRDGRP